MVLSVLVAANPVKALLYAINGGVDERGCWTTNTSTISEYLDYAEVEEVSTDVGLVSRFICKHLEPHPIHA